MHPAYSIIFFTTASGAGYGLLALLGLYGWLGLLPRDATGFAVTALGLSLVLITAGLLSSTFHLGHPERAWRALSQWRSSWLSREGVAAVLTYLPALALGLGWLGGNAALTTAAGLFCFVGAVATVVCTGMIYASLLAVPVWHSFWVPLVYLALGATSGGIWLLVLCEGFSVELIGLDIVVTAALAVAFGLKLTYWGRDAAGPTVSRESATGLGTLGGQRAKVTVLDLPHTEANYLQKEMGYVIARKHAANLRQHACLLAFAVPFLLMVLVLTLPVGGLSLAFAAAAALSMSAGVVLERWLFFAEAKHSVSVYYHEEQV